MRKGTLTLLISSVLWACGANQSLAHTGEPRAHLGAFSLEVVNESGSPLATFEHKGRTYVLGERGERYSIRLHNRSSRRVEAVFSVDGRDVIDGKPANWDKRGYLVDAYGELTIDGFRLDHDSVAAFRFSKVKDSYAAKMGDARDVGVIGVAIFPERAVMMPPRRYAYPSQRAEGIESGPSASGRSADTQAKGQPLGETNEAHERPGLGTEFGERRESQIVEVDFRRARLHHPDYLLAVRYNDRSGLAALGIDVDHKRRHSHNDLWQRETARPFRNMRASFAEPPPGWRD